MKDYSENDERRVFGVPLVLTAREREFLVEDLTYLWDLTYGHHASVLSEDVERCRRFFDPILRGLSLRERLAKLAPAASEVAERMRKYGEPLVVEAGEGILLVGVETRLVLELLGTSPGTRGHIVISPEAAGAAEREAMRIYRGWSLSRLRQVIDLRAGVGKEVMQAVAVGVVLALLVNRSDSPERAVRQRESSTADVEDVNRAIYECANSFADALTARNSRSASEQRLKGGYGLTEARRRLAHRLVLSDDPSYDGMRLVYIPKMYRDEVISFLGRDLARRPSLTVDRLKSAFDDLVSRFRLSVGALAYRSMVFELPADTDELRSELLLVFQANRSSAGAQ